MLDAISSEAVKGTDRTLDALFEVSMSSRGYETPFDQRDFCAKAMRQQNLADVGRAVALTREDQTLLGIDSSNSKFSITVGLK